MSKHKVKVFYKWSKEYDYFERSSYILLFRFERNGKTICCAQTGAAEKRESRGFLEYYYYIRKSNGFLYNQEKSDEKEFPLYKENGDGSELDEFSNREVIRFLKKFAWLSEDNQTKNSTLVVGWWKEEFPLNYRQLSWVCELTETHRKKQAAFGQLARDIADICDITWEQARGFVPTDDDNFIKSIINDNGLNNLFYQTALLKGLMDVEALVSNSHSQKQKILYEVKARLALLNGEVEKTVIVIV